MSKYSYTYVPRQRREALGKNLAKRNGHRCWSDDDLILLRSLYDQGLPTSEIATILSRTNNSVRLKLSRINYVSRVKMYSIDDDLYIKKNYGFKSLSEISSYLGVSISSLVDRATKQLSLKNRYRGENSHFSKFSDGDIELIRTLHDEGLSIADIACKFEASPSYVSRLVNFEKRAYLTISHT